VSTQNHEPVAPTTAASFDLTKIVQPGSLVNTLLAMGGAAFFGGFQFPGIGGVQRWVLSGFGLVFLLAGVVIRLAKGRPATRIGRTDGSPVVTDQPVLSQDQPAFVALCAAVDRVRSTLVRDRLVRSELVFRVDLAQYNVASVPNHGRVETATVDLAVSFTIQNLSNEHVSSALVAGFETSAASSQSPHTGSLDITRTRRDGQRDSDHRPISFAADPGRPIARAYDYTVDLPPGASAHIAWSANYVVDLPYGEFWATSVPTYGMRVEVAEALNPGFEVTADCYGGTAASFRRVHPRNTGGEYVVRRHIFEELGALLPYQGIFLRMRAIQSPEGA
jgi:hypothetical protein